MIRLPVVTRQSRLLTITRRAWLGRDRVRRRAASAVLAAAALAATVLAGCATVPTGGPVQDVGAGQSGVSQPQAYAQVIPVGPGPGWDQQQIVAGFLAASASFAGNHAVARAYLDSTAGRSWRPGWAVTVVSTTSVNIVQLPRPCSQLPGCGLANVIVTGQPVATLTGAGQYVVSAGPPTKYNFVLIKVGGQWRIDGLPRATPLLLTEAAFQRVYQSRDLYFLGPSGRTLVPEPVFVPQQATNTDLATGLVNALLQGPTGWLSGAATTGFPARSRQIGQVKIIGQNAIVNLSANAAAAGAARQQQMAAELAWTLAGGPSSIRSVELEINGKPLQVLGSAFQLPQAYRAWVPAQSGGSGMYFIGGNGSVDTLSSPGQPGSGRIGPAGAPRTPALSQIAVSPGGGSVAGISPDGGTVYISALGGGGTPREWHPQPNTRCTSVSWDTRGNLWITAGGDLWLLAPGASGADPVNADYLPAADDQVIDFRVAPDGVRAVMILSGVFNGKPGTQIELAAITRGASMSVGTVEPIGGGIADPSAVSWFGGDNVMALSGSPGEGQLDEVPLDGSTPLPIATPADAVSMTASSPGDSSSYIAVGLSDNQIMISAYPGGFQLTRASGSAPAFPG